MVNPFGNHLLGSVTGPDLKDPHPFARSATFIVEIDQHPTYYLRTSNIKLTLFETIYKYDLMRSENTTSAPTPIT